MSDYKLVPVEPTDDMATAAMNAETTANMLYGEPAAFSDIWNAMLAAAPAVQGEPVGEVRLEIGAPSVVYGELYSEAAPHLVPGTLLYTAPQPAPDVPGLTEALRQYQHNDGSGLVFGYDKLLVDQYVAQLVEALARCRHEASYSIGEEDALSIQLGKVRDIVNQTLSALAAHRKQQEGEA